MPVIHLNLSKSTVLDIKLSQTATSLNSFSIMPQNLLLNLQFSQTIEIFYQLYFLQKERIMRQAKLVESLQIIFSSYSYVMFTSINSPTYPIQLFCRTLVSILLALNFPKLNIQILESRRLSFMPFILFKFDSGSVGNQFNRTDPCNFYKCLCAHITADLSSSCFQTSDIIQRLTDL